MIIQKKPNVLCVIVKHNNKPVSGLYSVYIKQDSKSEFEKLKIFDIQIKMWVLKSKFNLYLLFVS